MTWVFILDENYAYTRLNDIRHVFPLFYGSFGASYQQGSVKFTCQLTDYSRDGKLRRVSAYRLKNVYSVMSLDFSTFDPEKHRLTAVEM
jgi:hypothetical protein